MVSLELGVVGRDFNEGHYLLSTRFYIHNPVLEHSELQEPGEDPPEARSISLSVSATKFTANLKAGGKAILQSPRKFESSRHQGHLSSSLGRVLSLEHWKAAKVHPILPKDILVEPQPSVCGEWL